MQHRSDCALHSSPAEIPSQCSCGAGDPRNEGLVSALTEHAHELDAENKLLHTQLDMITSEREGAFGEIKRLRHALNARLADHIDGTPCAAIRWQHEREQLQSQLAEALDVLRPLIGALHCGTHKLSQGEFIRVLQAGAALLADTTVSAGGGAEND